jgi:4-amino-4-deoxy-L-arabinose transferase-like glycosyltransferase
MPSFGDRDIRRSGFVAAALLITIYGGLLRFEALEANYGWLGQPRWSDQLARLVTPVIQHLRPSSIVWGPTRDPYVGSDPINYLNYAREMTHFYQGHKREPVFLALTRGYLWLTGGLDISVSFASVTGATLAILATYLLGAAAFSRGVGLGAALALAIEVTAISRSFQGWRDDTFMFVVALTGWSFLRLRQQPGRTTGIIAGFAAAAACLTRITSLSFVIPGFLWLLLETRGRAAQRDVRLAALVLVVLVAPYLVNCARVFGDPFVSISEHTTYYRAAEGLPHEQPMGVWSYLSTKIGSRPIRSIDTAAEGIVLHPFRNKWDGFDRWGSLLGPLLRLSAAAGMVLAVWSANGRFLLMLLFASLLPYALTWSVGGGGDWRFTQHAYPFYLVFASWMIGEAVRWTKALAADESARGWLISRRFAVRLATVVAIVGIMLAGYVAGPFLVNWEALRAGEAITIPVEGRSAWFFSGAWSQPFGHEPVILRAAQAPLVALRLPMPRHRDYWMTLRLDPAETVDPERQPHVTVFFNRHPLARLRLTRSAGRVGTYRIRVSRELARPLSRLDLLASHTVPAGESGEHFSSLPPGTPVAFRLWYVRIEPE